MSQYAVLQLKVIVHRIVYSEVLRIHRKEIQIYIDNRELLLSGPVRDSPPGPAPGHGA